MDSKKVGIFVLLEGNDDLAFFETVLKPFFEKDYFVVIPYRYSTKPNADVNKLIDSSISMKYDYLVFADLDTFKCVSTKKESLLKSYKKFEEKKLLLSKKKLKVGIWLELKTKELKVLEKGMPKKVKPLIKRSF